MFQGVGRPASRGCHPTRWVFAQPVPSTQETPGRTRSIAIIAGKPTKVRAVGCLRGRAGLPPGSGGRAFIVSWVAGAGDETGDVLGDGAGEFGQKMGIRIGGQGDRCVAK